MEIAGKLFTILPEVTGEGKNGRWVKADFVIETQDSKYPKKVCLTAWGDQVEQVKTLPIASDLKVSFDADSREYNGKWYTNLKAWKVEVTSGGSNNAVATSSSSHQSMPASAEENNNTRVVSEDDLPF